MNAEKLVMNYKKAQMEKNRAADQKALGGFFEEYIKPIQVLKENFPNHELEIQLEIERDIPETVRSNPGVRKMVAINRDNIDPFLVTQGQLRVIRTYNQPHLISPSLKHPLTHPAQLLPHSEHPLTDAAQSVAHAAQSLVQPAQSFAKASQPDQAAQSYRQPSAVPSHAAANQAQSLTNVAQPLTNEAKSVANGAPQLHAANIPQPFVQPAQLNQASHPLGNAAQHSAHAAHPSAQTAQATHTFVQSSQQVAQQAHVAQSITQAAQPHAPQTFVQPSQQVAHATQIAKPIAQAAQAAPLLTQAAQTFVQPAYPFSQIAQPIAQAPSYFPHQDKEKKPLYVDDLVVAMEKIVEKINDIQSSQRNNVSSAPGVRKVQRSQLNIKPIIELLERGVKIQHNVPQPKDNNLNWVQIKIPAKPK